MNEPGQSAPPAAPARPEGAPAGAEAGQAPAGAGPAEAAAVAAFWQDLWLPGLVDIHTHFMPPNVLAKVWAFFEGGRADLRGARPPSPADVDRRSSGRTRVWRVPRPRRALPGRASRHDDGVHRLHGAPRAVPGGAAGGLPR